MCSYIILFAENPRQKMKEIVDQDLPVQHKMAASQQYIREVFIKHLNDTN